MAMRLCLRPVASPRTAWGRISPAYHPRNARQITSAPRPHGLGNVAWPQGKTPSSALGATVLAQIAEPLPPADRGRFLERVAELLAGVEVGDGSVTRAAKAGAR